MEDKIYSEYCAILAEELQPAMGCTEPIAVAYCAALARKTLGCLPEDVAGVRQRQHHQECQERGRAQHRRPARADCRAAAGIVAGDADAQLQVLAGITPEQVEQIAGYEKRASSTSTPRTKTTSLTFRCG